jgi:hypothetical protein
LSHDDEWRFFPAQVEDVDDVDKKPRQGMTFYDYLSSAGVSVVKGVFSHNSLLRVNTDLYEF